MHTKDLPNVAPGTGGSTIIALTFFGCLQLLRWYDLYRVQLPVVFFRDRDSGRHLQLSLIASVFLFVYLSVCLPLCLSLAFPFYCSATKLFNFFAFDQTKSTSAYNLGFSPSTLLYHDTCTAKFSANIFVERRFNVSYRLTIVTQQLHFYFQKKYVVI